MATKKPSVEEAQPVRLATIANRLAILGVTTSTKIGNSVVLEWEKKRRRKLAAGSPKPSKFDWIPPTWDFPDEKRPAPLWQWHDVVRWLVFTERLELDDETVAKMDEHGWLPKDFVEA